MNWEEAVKQLRHNATDTQVILDNYFDEDILASAERFSNSNEFMAVMTWVPKGATEVLDIGAGRGIASYAFAKRNFTVTALEPDPSNDVGAGAIRHISAVSKLPIQVVESFGEKLPFYDNSFDVVYARQVLHHAAQLHQFCKEVSRVLKPGGVFIAVREHVISSQSDLSLFLAKHPLHKLYGGENAFTLAQYKEAILSSGMKLNKVLHPYASEINYAPLSQSDLKLQFAHSVAKLTGKKLALTLLAFEPIFKVLCAIKSFFYHEPGRLYSFIAVKL
ncbi:MAG: class I SAM-dependent methyltransferase [Bacteroidota bacterium]|jgi:ubiquinone/menaquinone biosynthesis C-methylase UbiE